MYPTPYIFKYVHLQMKIAFLRDICGTDKNKVQLKKKKVVFVLVNVKIAKKIILTLK